MKGVLVMQMLYKWLNGMQKYKWFVMFYICFLLIDLAAADEQDNLF